MIHTLQKNGYWIVLTLCILCQPAMNADIQIEREVVIAPKTGRAAANIGPVNQKVHIAMTHADVDIRLGAVPAGPDEPLAVAVDAAFRLTNDSDQSLAITVGFPVSDSSYSSFALTAFSVRSNGVPCSVFKRVTRYPWSVKHIHISGPKRDGGALPDYADVPVDAGEAPGSKARDVFGNERIGTSSFHNLMVWEDSFAAGETKTIEVAYTMAVPLQPNRVQKKTVTGNHKGIWPQEANNMPADFLQTLPGGNNPPDSGLQAYYFFDYYLESGASWKGPIGEETITLHLDGTWQGHRLFSNKKDQLTAAKTGGDAKPCAMTYSYSLRDAEPSENVYFALQRP